MVRERRRLTLAAQGKRQWSGALTEEFGRQGAEMSWQEDHRKRVAGFPVDIQRAHTHSGNHRAEVTASTLCGCFYCCESFPPAEIAKWVDEDRTGEGQTALCPKCGIDSVIGDDAGFPVSQAFLAAMKAHWF